MSPIEAQICRQLIDRYADQPLMIAPRSGARLTRRDGYLPLLADFTHEDKEAKGLRSLANPAAERPPVYFSALEMAAEHEWLLILGEAGSGKTSFALDLAMHLAGERLGEADLNLCRLRTTLPRNELGLTAVEAWPIAAATPVYLPVEGPSDLGTLLGRHAPDVEALLGDPSRAPILIILDGADRLGRHGLAVLEALAATAARFSQVRLLVTGRPEVCASWPLPEGFVSHGLLPLLSAQRAAYQSAHGLAASKPFWPTRPDLFMLAVGLGEDPAPAYRLVDRWLDQVMPQADQVERLASWVFDRIVRGSGPGSPDLDIAEALRGAASAPLLTTTLAPFLAARHLMSLSSDALSALFLTEPQAWADSLRILAQRMSGAGESTAPLVDLLVHAPGAAGAMGAVIGADILSDLGAEPGDEVGWRVVKPALAALIERGDLTATERRAASLHLARQGDPRDLEALISLPAGEFTMGSVSHVNSAPVHRLSVQAFRMGRYPVTNQAYARFVLDTGRLWRSPDGHDPERANIPATDLTWRDARAYCEWLTPIWRRDGRIGPRETVRLPTEPEWEYAARGPSDRAPEAPEEIVYPWAGPWAPDHANSAETGFNAPCAVGLFPKGRSAAGLDDMSGQVWEWTTTLWGADMATPSFAYPYTEDGRETAEARPQVRRVLRGGCFSSNKLKACCTYRGSLEPDGFWRGNGFRVVVS